MKRLFKRRSLAYGSQTLLSTLLFLGIVILLAVISQKHSLRWDITEAKQHTLTEQSRKIVSSITEPVRIIAFYATDEGQEEAKDLLETYRYYNSKISYEFIDPDRNPELAKKYEIRTYGTLVLEGYGKKETVQGASEESVTNALLKLSRTGKKKIYFLIGHGEHSIEEFGKAGYSTVRSSLEKGNYEVAALNLMSMNAVPDDASVVVVAGPKKELLPEEIERLDGYIKKGGKLVIMLDPYQDAGLKDWLGKYGIELYDDVIIDKLSRVFGGSYLLPVVTQYGFHPITKDFSVATFYPEARSVREASNPPDYISLTTLARTSEGAWAETDREMLQKGQAAYDEGKDLAGPVPIAVIAEVNVEKMLKESNKKEDKKEGEGGEERKEALKKGYLLVIGDSDFVDNTHFGLSGNGDFFLNALHYLAEEETLITIEPRKKEGQPLVLTASQMKLVMWVTMVLVPLLVIAFGAGVYRIRRAQR